MGRRNRGPLKSSFSTTIEMKDGSPMDVVVEYSYSPSTPDVFYLSNGDPGYPGDPEEAEVLGITEDKKDGRIIRDEELADGVLDSLTERICEEAREEDESRYLDAMEARAEARAERDWD